MYKYFFILILSLSATCLFAANNKSESLPKVSWNTEQDKKIAEKIRNEIRDGWFVKGYNVTADVSNGSVSLKGTADSPEEKKKIEDIVLNISGVKDLNSTISISKKIDSANSDQAKGQWNEFKGKAKQQWGRLTDDDFKKAEGKSDELVGILQQKYGYTKSQAEQEIAKWEKSLNSAETKDKIVGQWNIIKGKVKQQWGKLTDDDITRINGKKDELLGILQKRYGYTEEQAKIEVSKWEKTQGSSDDADKEDDN